MTDMSSRKCIGLALSLTAVSGFGACVNGHPSVSKEYAASKAVLVAKVVGRSSVPALKDGFFLDGTMYRLALERTLYGQIYSAPEVFSENSSGRFPMKLGATYLLFVYVQHGRFLVNYCGNSGLLSNRTKELKQVEQLRARP